MAIKFKNLTAGGSGGSASVVGEGGYVGTAIPVNENVEKIYVNTNLSNEEVLSIVKNVAGDNEQFEYQLYGDGTFNIFITCLVSANALMIMTENTDTGEETFLFVNQEMTDLYGQSFGFIGWNPDVSNPIVVNNTNLGDSNYDNNETINSALSSLFSTTPFGTAPGESIALSGEYDGATLEVTSNQVLDIESLLSENKLPLKIIVNVVESSASYGTPVPNSGTVEKVYLNIALSIEEVSTILNKVDYTTNDGYFVISNADVSKSLCFAKVNPDDSYPSICDMNMETYYFIGSQSLADEKGVSLGWQSVSELDFNDTAISELEGMSIGAENELLKELFSITPFE